MMCALQPPPRFQRSGQIRGGIFGVPLLCTENMCSYFPSPLFYSGSLCPVLVFLWMVPSLLHRCILHNPKAARLFSRDPLLPNGAVSLGIYWLCVGTQICAAWKSFCNSPCALANDASCFLNMQEQEKFQIWIDVRSIITMSAISSPGWR